MEEQSLEDTVEGKKTAYLAPDVILSLLITPDSSLGMNELLLKINSGELHVILSDFAVGEALACIHEGDVVNWTRFGMLIQKAEFIFTQKLFGMREERKEHLRGLALKKGAKK